MNRSLPTLLAVVGGLAALPGTASAAVGCGHDGAAHKLSITSSEDGDRPGIRRDGPAIVVTKNGQPVDCTGAVATVENTDAIALTDFSPLHNFIGIDLSDGPMAPGLTGEGQLGTPEIEILVNGGGGFDLLQIEGTAGPDAYRLGTFNSLETRVNLNPTGEVIADADIVATGVERVSAIGAEGGDVIDARGGAGTAGPLLNELVAYGYGGNDSLYAGAGGSSLDGGSGEDRIAGGTGADAIIGGPGADLLDGGLGGDILDGGGGTDTLDYSSRTAPVAIRLDGSKNDGHDPNGDGISSAAEEGDHAKNVENAIGGAGPDRLRAIGDTVNQLLGGPGDDRLDGGAAADVLDGGAGADTISYAGRPGGVGVTLDGLANDGADPVADGVSTAAEEGDRDKSIEHATGGDGPDRLKALGLAVNVLAGGPGADLLDTRNDTTTVDVLDCGTGRDTYRSDASDTKDSCETQVSR